MKPWLRLLVMLVAAIAQIGVPVIGYAAPAPSAMARDVCSVFSRAPSERPSPAPLPATDPHRCAQSSCCIGAATPAWAPPPATATTARGKPGAWRVCVAAQPVVAAGDRYGPRPRGPPALV